MKISKYRSIALGACVALVAVAVGVAPAMADETAGGEDATVVVGGSSAASASRLLPEDAKALAEDLKISEEAAQRQFAGQQEFLEALTKAIESVPDRYASSEWGAVGESSAWVSFTGAEDSKVADLFADLPVKVEVRFGAKLSEAEAEEIRHEAMSELLATGTFSQLVGETDPTAGSVRIQYELKDGEVADSVIARAVSAVVKSSEKAEIDVVEATEDISTDPELIRGGTSISGCTAGFNIRILGSPQYKGFVTAAHCPNAAGTPSGSTYGTVHRGQHAGAYGEVQKHSSSDPLIGNTIIIAPSSYRSITSVVYPSAGQSICNYGKTRSAHSCTTVRQVGLAFYANIDGTSTYISRMVQSNGAFTNPGDSGGPWFVNNSAVGIHYGKFGGYSTFSQAGFAQSVLSIAIITG